MVFAHHPVYQTVMGSYTNSNSLNKLGWNPRYGELPEHGSVSVTNGSTEVYLSGALFNLNKITPGSEFQIKGEVDWYTISSVTDSAITLTTPYIGATGSDLSYYAGGHFNELNEIFKDTRNSIKLLLTGHIQATQTGHFEEIAYDGHYLLEKINDKIFAHSGHIAPSYLSYRLQRQYFSNQWK